LLFCLINNGCRFQLRDKSALPAQLHRLYLAAEKPYSPLSVRLKATLCAIGVDIVKQPDHAPFSLVVSDDVFSGTQPQPVNASLPTSITYAQHAIISIKDNCHQTIVISKKFVESRSLTLNANQIYTSNFESLMRTELNNEMESLIYYWLTSTNMKNALRHANITRTTQCPS